MMTEDDLIKLEKRFYTYTNAFITRADDPYPHALKQEHTLGGSDEVRLTRAAGLVHDLNFTAAVRAVLDMGVVEAILDSMPGFSGRRVLERCLKV